MKIVLFCLIVTFAVVSAKDFDFEGRYAFVQNASSACDDKWVSTWKTLAASGVQDPASQMNKEDHYLCMQQVHIDAEKHFGFMPDASCARCAQPSSATSQCSNGDDGCYASSCGSCCAFGCPPTCQTGGTSTYSGTCSMYKYRSNGPAGTCSPQAFCCAQDTAGYPNYWLAGLNQGNPNSFGLCAPNLP